MTTAGPLRSYRTISTQTAPPSQLVLMLCKGAIRFLEKALAVFHYTDPLDFNLTINNNVLRAQEILNELNHSPDLNQRGELAATLRRLYDYMDWQLMHSNMHKTPAGMHDTIRRLSILRDAWGELSCQQAASAAAPEPFAALSARS